MNTLSLRRAARVAAVLALLAPALLFNPPAARAGLTFEVYLYTDNQTYVFYTPLSTNATPPAAPLGTYLIYSPQQPTNGAWRQLELTTNGMNTISGGEYGYGDYASVMQQITNGAWRIVVTNATSTNTYEFTVSAPNMSSNLLPLTTITFPADGATGVTNQPTFTWQGPTNWPGPIFVQAYQFDASYNTTFWQSDVLPADQSSWTIPAPIPVGTNTTFYLNTSTNYATPLFVATTPLNTNNAQPLAGWTSATTLQSGGTVNFMTVAPAVGGGGHRLVARYDFEQTGSPGTDSSGNGNNSNCGSGNGGTNLDTASTDAISGAYARDYFGDTSLCFTPPSGAFDSLSNALHGSFSVSAWVKTTASVNQDFANAYFGSPILFAYNSNTNSTVPLSLTGGKVAFTVNDDTGQGTTLHSTSAVNDGQYHHIAVTRSLATGLMEVYVDGALEGTANGPAVPIFTPNIIYLAGGWYVNYEGLLDDVQVYSGVLSASEMAALHSQPGSTAPDVSGSGLQAHYDFDEGAVLAPDVSGNNNNVVYAGNFGSAGPAISSDTAAGAGSVSFDGGSYLTASPNLLTTLAGDFSVSVWLKTSQSMGSSDDMAYWGAAVVSADLFTGGVPDVLPIALTAGQVAFNTGDGSTDQTLNSAATVNDGSWHHVVVTRKQSTGEKQIFVDGLLDSSQVGPTVSLAGPRLLTIGAKSDASDPNPSSPDSNGSQGYEGLLDDLQFYAGVLSGNQVNYLYSHPGQVISNLVGNLTLGDAVDAPLLPWTTGGDWPWFGESTVTHDGIDAAQSGAVGNDQSSWIETTLTGPGEVSFWWKVSSDNVSSFDALRFDSDGSYVNEISGEVDWTQVTYQVECGSHTLRWTYYKDAAFSAGLDAGFLDQFTFTPGGAPEITTQPFSQTNHPSYSVALQAGASGTPGPTWQWYKVGSGAISGATSALYIPTNSGTAGGGGDYYAVASNCSGSANTYTATVSFVSAPLPPDWALVFKSPANNNLTATEEYYIACLPDSSGNFYTVASFTGTNTYGADTFVSTGGAFETVIVKQTATGSLIWARAMTNNGHGSSFPQSVAAAPGDGLYVLGFFSGTNWLGANVLAESAGGSIYLARFDASGNNLWVATITGTNFCFPTYFSLVADPAGNVTLSGLIYGNAIFGTTNVIVSGQQGALAQYDANGAFRWVQATPGWMSRLTYNAGRIYGSMGTPSTDFNFGAMNLVTDRAKTLVALNATDGQPIWLRGIGAPFGQENPLGLVLDEPVMSVSGTNVFIVGTSVGSNAAFGPYSASWPGNGRQYFARCDTNGTPQLLTTFGSPTTMPWAALADASGNVYVGGDFDTYSEFGQNIIAGYHLGSIGNGYFSDGFLAKFDRNGNPLWARLAQPQSGYVNFRGLALVSNDIWACGFYKSPATFGTNQIWSSFELVGSPIGTFVWHTSGGMAKIPTADGGCTPPIAGDATYSETKGQPFKISETDLLTHASGSGGVSLASVPSTSANGVSLSRSGDWIFYNGNLTANDSFSYTVSANTGGCTASGTVTINMVPTTGTAQSITVSGGTATVSFAGIPGYAYAIQRSIDNLATWQTVRTTNAPPAGLFSFMDDFQGFGVPPASAFYRLLQP